MKLTTIHALELTPRELDLVIMTLRNPDQGQIGPATRAQAETLGIAISAALGQQ